MSEYDSMTKAELTAELARTAGRARLAHRRGERADTHPLDADPNPDGGDE